MNVNLTIQDGVQLTGLQHRGIISGTLPADDYVAKNYGNQLEVTYSGWVFTVKTGMAVLNGSGCENPTQFNMTFPTPSGSGTAMVIAKINLATNIASIEFKTGTTLTQNNLVANSTGVREYELYRFTYTSSAVTGLTDKRIIKTMQEVISALDSRISTLETRNVFTELWSGTSASGGSFTIPSTYTNYDFLYVYVRGNSLGRYCVVIIPKASYNDSTLGEIWQVLPDVSYTAIDINVKSLPTITSGGDSGFSIKKVYGMKYK